jgi:hypothetical protein
MSWSAKLVLLTVFIIVTIVAVPNLWKFAGNTVSVANNLAGRANCATEVTPSPECVTYRAARQAQRRAAETARNNPVAPHWILYRTVTVPSCSEGRSDPIPAPIGKMKTQYGPPALRTYIFDGVGWKTVPSTGYSGSIVDLSWCFENDLLADRSMTVHQWTSPT